MPSPFPGMDPFLEDSDEWSTFHAWLIVALSNQLADAVAPDFFVRIEQRLYFEIRDRYIEVRDTRSREVVTTVELLSPFNKTPGHQGYDAFQNKRRQVMASDVHWIEVDLLRAGERPPEVAGQSDYYALLKRGGAPSPFEVWFFNVRDTMPTIAVPLRPPFADVPLDLQAALAEVYARAHYADGLDYSRSVPPPRLRPADATWVATRVQAWLDQRGEPA